MYAPDGTPSGSWGLTGAPQGTAPFPDSAVRVTAAPDGTLFALFRSRIVEHLDQGGVVLGSFNLAAGGSTFMGSAQIVTASNGDVIVGAERRIFRFSGSGQLLGTLAYFGLGLTINAADDLFETSGDQMLRIHSDGTVSVLYAAPPGAEFQEIAATATGVAATSASGVLLINADGTLRGSLGAPDPGQLQAPWAAWGTRDGGLLVADSGNRRIAHYAPSGDYLGRADAGGDIFPTFGAFEPLGGGSVVVDAATSTLKRLSVDGGLLAQWPARYNGSPYSATGVAVAPDGTVYVTSAASVYAYTPGGSQVRQISDQHAGGRTVPAVGPSGQLYLAGFSRQGVAVFGPDGAYAGSVPGLECTSVTSIAIPAGRIFVLERTGLGYSGIGVLAPDGTWLAQFGSTLLDGALSVDANDRLTIAFRMQNAVVRLQIDVGALHPIKPSVPTGSACNLAIGTPSLPSTTLLVTRRVVSLRIACTGPPAARCVGISALRAAANRPRRAKRAQARTTTVLARGAFAIQSGHTAVVPLRLSRRYAASKRKTRALLTITPAGGRPQVHHVYLRQRRPARAR